MPQLVFDTALGACRVAWEGDWVTEFRLPGPETAAAPHEDPNADADPPAWIRDLGASVQRHLEGSPVDFAEQPYAFERVTPFQASVYRAALAVKAGSTSTYGSLAAALGLPPGASRAVGAALGRNPWPLLVPCHRFVGADGAMTGFSAPGGTSIKLKLLALEGAQWFAV